jgi:hypothetical protein
MKDDKESSELNEFAKRVWKGVDRLRAEGKLPPPPTPEEMADEPTALANSGYRERAEREALEREDMEERKYPPISPETSNSKPMGALGRRKEEESKKAMEELKHRALNEMKVQLALDPEIEWTIKTVDGKSYLSVKQN